MTDIHLAIRALAKLILRQNGLLTKEGGKAIADMLAANTVLKELDVSDNYYSTRNDDAPGFAKELADGVKNNGALTSLNLRKNMLCGINLYGNGKYDATGLTALTDAIGKHP